MVEKLPASAGDAGDLGLIPRPGRSPGGGSGFPLQCFCPGLPFLTQGPLQVLRHLQLNFQATCVPLWLQNTLVYVTSGAYNLMYLDPHLPGSQLAQAVCRSERSRWKRSRPSSVVEKGPRCPETHSWCRLVHIRFSPCLSPNMVLHNNNTICRAHHGLSVISILFILFDFANSHGRWLGER